MTVSAVLVVVPARDEEQEIGACLTAVADALGRVAPDVRRLVVVVDDGSVDGTGAIARGTLVELGVPHDVVRQPGGNVGRARDVGFAHGLAHLGEQGVDAAEVWCATTDADCRPLPAWLLTHLVRAEEGADAVAGLVAVTDWAPRHPRAAKRWERLVLRDGCAEGHSHVHGANLGWRGSAGLAIGGVPHLAVAEDHSLWRRLQAGGWTTCAVADVGVVTSARRSTRAPGGFSSLLDRLEITRPSELPLSPTAVD